MSKALHFALLASVAVHAVFVAVLRQPSPDPLPSVLHVSLHQEALPPSLPIPTERPVRQHAANPPKAGQAGPATPLAIPANTSAPTAMPVVPADHQVAATQPVISPAPAALEPPRYDAAYLANPPPAYPHSAKRRGIEGTAMLDARVGAGGEAQEVKLAASAGDAALDDAALAAVRAWRFVPARRGSEPVEAWVRIPVVFHLN